MENGSSCKVCVTGGTGYIGSSLVKKLFNQGYTVHTTLRNFKDESKVNVLKSFPGAEERLKLFEADIYKADEFEAAIQGCEFVFHVANPLQHTEGYQYNNRVDATVDAAKRIAALCIRAGTVRRLIYTASVTAASPLKEDGSGFKEVMDESCWTPLNLSVPYSNDYVWEYTQAKTLAEKALLSFNTGNEGGMDVVTLACGLVGGENPMPYTTGSVAVFLSHLTNDELAYNSLKFLEELCGKIPVVHIEDVCNAHIFCIQQQSMSGRFLCANAYVFSADIAKYFQGKYPELVLKEKYLECPERETKWGSTQLIAKGFEYKCDWLMVLDDCISYAKKIADIGL